jgi:hypothetical protein
MSRVNAAPDQTVSFPTLVDFGCILRLVSDWVSEGSSEAAVRSAANVLHALDTALRLDRLGAVHAVSGHPPRTLLAHLEHAATEVLRSQAVKDAASVDEILAVTRRRVQVLRQMLDVTGSPAASTFGEFRERAVSFIDLLIDQGPKLPASAAGVIAKAVLVQLRNGRFDVPEIEDSDVVRDRIAKKIAPLIESATSHGKKLKRDGAADIFGAAMRAIGIDESGALTSVVAGSGSARSRARAPDRPRARRRPRDR